MGQSTPIRPIGNGLTRGHPFEWTNQRRVSCTASASTTMEEKRTPPDQCKCNVIAICLVRSGSNPASLFPDQQLVLLVSVINSGQDKCNWGGTRPYDRGQCDGDGRMEGSGLVWWLGSQYKCSHWKNTINIQVCLSTEKKILRRRVKCFNITYTHFWQDHNKVEMNPFNVFLLGMKEKPYL